MNIQGNLIEIFETEQVTDKFKRREFVLEIADNPQYPETVSFQFIQDKCEILDSYKIGDSVDVSFNLKGRKWTSPKGEVKYFNTLQCWKINKVEQSSNSAPSNQDRPLGDSSLPF